MISGCANTEQIEADSRFCIPSELHATGNLMRSVRSAPVPGRRITPARIAIPRYLSLNRHRLHTRKPVLRDRPIAAMTIGSRRVDEVLR